MNFIVVLLIVASLDSISAKSKCTKKCLTKTYCLSSSGTSSCSKNNLVTAEWSVVQTSGNYDTVGLTLTSGKIKSSDIRSISLNFKSSSRPGSQTNYTCFKSAVGVSASVTQKSSTKSEVIQRGNSSYSGSVLTCFWSFTVNDNIWPLYYDGLAPLLSDKSGTLKLKSDSVGAVVAQNVGDLPIYHLQYLKCCNKVHGNNNYLTIFNQSSDDQYVIRTTILRPKTVTLSLNSTTGMKLIFTCDFSSSRIDAVIFNGTASTSISNKIYGQKIYSAYNNKCSWSHPLQLNGPFGKLDTTKSVFDMKITADGSVVYTEKGVKLKNSSTKLVSTLSIIIMTISVFFQLYL